MGSGNGKHTKAGETDAPGDDLRIAGAFRRGDEVKLLLDGKPINAYEGESIAAALLAAGIRRFRATAVTGEPRGPYCGMGVCFECLMEVDGQPNVRTCQTAVRDGMRLRMQVGLGRWDAGQ
jgi:predicted molibdopterin-dependent oxidoreductase YjgC